MQHAKCNTQHTHICSRQQAVKIQRRSLASSSHNLKHVYDAWAQRLPCYLRTVALLGSLPSGFWLLPSWLLLLPVYARFWLPLPLLLDCQEFPRTLIATSQHSVASQSDKEIPFHCSFITPFVR